MWCSDEFNYWGVKIYWEIGGYGLDLGNSGDVGILLVKLLVY